MKILNRENFLKFNLICIPIIIVLFLMSSNIFYENILIGLGIINMLKIFQVLKLNKSNI